eukprot:9020212-Pyramimonas_sp.AAC.1
MYQIARGQKRLECANQMELVATNITVVAAGQRYKERLVEEGYQVDPLCARCGNALSPSSIAFGTVRVM